MNRLILSFFITLFLYIILFLILSIDLKKNPPILPQKHRFNISSLKILQQKPLPKKPAPKKSIPKPQPKKQKEKPKKQKERKKLIKKSIYKKIKKAKKRVPKKRVHTKKVEYNTTTPLPSLMQLFAKKSPSHPANTLPSRIKKLYKDEFDTFTNEQKEFIKNNLAKIGLITQKYLYLRGYPYIAAKMKEEGTNIVEFYLHPNGDITGVKLVTSSGYEALDKNSIETIKAAYKDYPLPPQTTKIKIFVHYAIIY